MIVQEEAGKRGVGRDRAVVKICGLTRPEHAALAARLGADMAGVVFAQSRRQVSVERALEVREAIDRAGARRKPLLVGVFVNEALERVVSVARTVGLDVVQLSGDETPDYVARCVGEYRTIKALRFPGDSNLPDVLAILDRYERAIPHGSRDVRFLVDAYRPGEYGGTGEVADWDLASALARHRRIILAGGLNPKNVRDAIMTVAPWGVDVSSGIESGGAKDPRLIREFLVAAGIS
jgi:phosphoribosylanthranilate isomerase